MTKILIVDDSPAEVRLMQSVLDRAGYMSVPVHDPMRLEQMIDKEQAQFTFAVDKLPAQAGIDPLYKLIDRNPDDNVIKVKKQ